MKRINVKLDLFSSSTHSRPDRRERTWRAIVSGGALTAIFSVFFSATAWGQSTLDRAIASPMDPIPPVQAVDLGIGMIATAQAFRHAADAIEPCLVTIESFGGVSTVQGRIGGIRKQGEGATTGLIISTDGYLVTSTFNFIQRQPVISVITADGVRRFAKIVGQDSTRKICLLKIDEISDLPVPTIAKLSDMKVGQWTISVGVGYGDSVPAISKGILSALNRIGGRAIQTDANISPANYGGPLLDIQGRVMGICVPLDPQSAAIGAGVEWYDSGIGFAIPLDGADGWLDRLKQGENISPAFLGVQVIPNPEGKNGLWIQQVVTHSAAQQADLMRGDLIVAIDGTAVNDLLRLKQILNRKEALQVVRLSVLKEGGTEPIEVEVTLGEPPPDQPNRDPLEPPRIR